MVGTPEQGQEGHDEALDAPWPPQAIVSPSDFREVDYNAIIGTVSSACCAELEIAFHKAAQANRAIEPAFSVYRIFASACSLHFHPDDRACVFGAKYILNNMRSALPEDWHGVQTEHFSEILNEIEHPALRARLADIAWLNGRKTMAAEIAVMAYCECVERLISGAFKAYVETDNEVSWEEIDLLARAAKIHAASKPRSMPMHQRVATLCKALYARALRNAEVVTLRRIAEMLSRYSLISTYELASDLEAAANAAEKMPKPLFEAIKRVWEVAAHFYATAGRRDDVRRCRLASVEQTLKMAHQSDTFSVAAHWYRQAIGELREIEGTRERRDELYKEMRRLQEQSIEEVSSYTLPLDLSDEIKGTLEVFGTLDLPEGLRQFALLGIPDSAADLRRNASVNTGLADTLFGSTYLDNDGKITAELDGAPPDGTPPSEAWLKSKMARQLELIIHMKVSGHIEPARELLSTRFPFSERHFHFIASHSPFVPDGYVHTFALGLARMMQGDIASAAAILIPQLEHCLRHVLGLHEIQSSKIYSDLTQDDRSLHPLLEKNYDDLCRIFGEDAILLIDILFNNRTGPALRHQFAHGKIGDRSFSDPSILYACCFIFLMVCRPLFRHWDQHVAPAIAASAY